MSYEFQLVFGIFNLLMGLWCFVAAVRLGVTCLQDGWYRFEKIMVPIGVVFGLLVAADGAWLLNTL
jgi:hypothetical protein